MRPVEQRRLPVTASIYDRGAERLFDAIAATCDPRAGFAARVEAGLRAGLSFLARDPILARTRVVEAELDEQALRRRQHWQERGSELLRGAALSLESHPDLDFMERTLIGGISSLIAQQVVAGEAGNLELLLPGLLEFVLIFYLGPAEVARIARAARTAS
jgi:hypothetical protein